MTTNNSCDTTTYTQNCGSGNGYLIVLVVFILLAIILSSYFVF